MTSDTSEFNPIDPKSVVALIENHIKTHDDEIYGYLKENTTEELHRLIFTTIRANGGLRLSAAGHKLLGGITKSHMVRLPEDFKIKAKHLLFLNDWCECPYYIDDIQICLYDRKDAFLLKMAEDNFDGLVDNYLKDRYKP